MNGARVITEKQDIHIPQGIAHAVDRVMFPLPVGDLVQTLQADRERRFSNFLKALFTSGMADSLSGSGKLTSSIVTSLLGIVTPSPITLVDHAPTLLIIWRCIKSHGHQVYLSRGWGEVDLVMQYCSMYDFCKKKEVNEAGCRVCDSQ